MPKFRYSRLCVLCYQPVEFDPADPSSLRQAVEHLKTLKPSPFVGILVETLIRAGRFRIQAPGFLRLDQITGKRPSEVWKMLDHQIDKQIEYFKRR